MIVPEQIFENKLKEMYLQGDEGLGKVSHVCLKPKAKHFFLSSEKMRQLPEYVSENRCTARD